MSDGRQLLRMLELGGWVVDPPAGREPRAAFAGGVLVSAAKNGHQVSRAGVSLAEVAVEVFEEAVRVQRLSLDQHVQLELAAQPD